MELNKSMFQQVSEFTLLRLNAGKNSDDFVPLPTKPTTLTKLEVQKFIGLCASELVELARTVTGSNAEALEFTKKCIGMDPSSNEPEFKDEIDVIAEQCDSVIDICYYAMDISASHGFPIDKAFAEVQRANMSKTFENGSFHLKEISPGIFKVAKPPTFKSPDIRSVVIDAMKK